MDAQSPSRFALRRSRHRFGLFLALGLAATLLAACASTQPQQLGSPPSHLFEAEPDLIDVEGPPAIRITAPDRISVSGYGPVYRPMPPARCFFAGEELDLWIAIFAGGRDTGPLNAPIHNPYEGNQIQLSPEGRFENHSPIKEIASETETGLIQTPPPPDLSDIRCLTYHFTITYDDGSTRTLVLDPIMGTDVFASRDRMYNFSPPDGEMFELFANASGC